MGRFTTEKRFLTAEKKRRKKETGDGRKGDRKREEMRLKELNLKGRKEKQERGRMGMELYLAGHKYRFAAR
jgi:hypothetical protein